jgi:hypothetical protein
MATAVWVIGRYRFVAPFSLRSSGSTSSGGKTNLVPTMYAFKLALVDAAYAAGWDGEAVFPLVRSLVVRFEPPEEAVVNQTLIKVLKEARGETDLPYAGSVAYREFVWYRGDLRVAVAPESDWTEGERGRVLTLMRHVNYLGKRGGFVQYVGVEVAEDLGPAFGYVPGDTRSSIAAGGVVQQLDDLPDTATFERINTFSDESARLGRDRVLVTVTLPYRQVASSRGYTRYRRVV